MEGILKEKIKKVNKRVRKIHLQFYPILMETDK